MKIIGINSKLSGPNWVALTITPTLTGEMFDEIKKLCTGPLLSSLHFELVNGCLVFRCVGGLDQHVSHNIEEVLKVATTKYEESQNYKRQQAESQAGIEKSMKDSAINAAADFFGVPIQ